MSTLQEKVNLAFKQAHLKDNAPTKTETASVKKAWLKEAWPELEKPSLMNLAQKKWKEREGN